MLSLILMTMLSQSPEAIFPHSEGKQPSLNEQLFGTDPAILAEVAKRDHTKHWISYGIGSAFVMAGSIMVSKDHKFGGTVVITMGLPVAIMGGLGLLNLSE